MNFPEALSKLEIAGDYPIYTNGSGRQAIVTIEVMQIRENADLTLNTGGGSVPCAPRQYHSFTFNCPIGTGVVARTSGGAEAWFNVAAVAIL